MRKKIFYYTPRMKKPPPPKPSIRTISEDLSRQLYFVPSSYRFKEKKNSYDVGFLKAVDWVEDLCLHYIREDERLKAELLEVLKDNKAKISKLKRSPKTQGMLDAIETALSYVKIPPSNRESG